MLWRNLEIGHKHRPYPSPGTGEVIAVDDSADAGEVLGAVCRGPGEVSTLKILLKIYRFFLLFETTVLTSKWIDS